MILSESTLMIVWLVATGMIACPRDCHGDGILSSHWPLQSSTHADSEHTGTCGRMVAGIQILVMWTSNTETNTPIRSLFPQWGILLKFIFVAPFLGLKKRIKRATVNRDVDSHSSARGQFSIHLNRSRPILKKGRPNVTEMPLRIPSLPSKCVRISQKMQNSAPMVRWYSSSPVSQTPGAQNPGTGLATCRKCCYEPL